MLIPDLSHVCAQQDFEAEQRYSHQYLDISFTSSHRYSMWSQRKIEFSFRGTRDRNSAFNNLFEFLLFQSWNG